MQNVQRIVNDLAKDGLVAFEINPHHKRAQLVVLTAVGQAAYGNAVQAWYLTTGDLAKGLLPDELAITVRVLSTLPGTLAKSITGKDGAVAWIISERPQPDSSKQVWASQPDRKQPKDEWQRMSASHHLPLSSCRSASGQ